MSNKLQDQVCLVTGAASGLGRAISLAYAREAASLVVCVDLTPDPPRKSSTDGSDADAGSAADDEVATHELIGKLFGKNKAVYVKADVTIIEQMKAAVDKAVEFGGRLDVIVNNAGIGPGLTRLHETPVEVLDRALNINVRGVFIGMKCAIEQFLKQDISPNGHRGWIVNMASVVALRETPNSLSYNASKAAVISMSRTAALEYAGDKIHCNALCPGFVETPMTLDLFAQPQIKQWFTGLTPWGWNKEPVADIACAAVFLVSKDAGWITGVTLPVDGGFHVHA